MGERLRRLLEPPQSLAGTLMTPASGPVTLQAIQAARAAIAPLVRRTPTWESLTLADYAGHPVLLKCEHMQRTGSFKVRGAANFVAHLPAGDRARGLVTASAGNHAQGIALAGSSAGLDVKVVMPSTAPLAKANAARGYGARVVLTGATLEDARAEAMATAQREGRIYVPPFDDDHVIAGQGTLALEILEDVPGVAEVLVPAGGGGLLAGVATAIKETRPDIRVIGVQAAAMDGICRSFSAGAPLTTPSGRTIADGVAVAGPSARTFALIERNVDEMVSCTEDAIARAIVLLIERSKMVVEGAGALGAAAIQSGVYRPRGPACVVLSGGNIDINLLGSIVRRGLVDAHRYQHITIEVSDTPGELALVTSVIAAAGGNIIEVDHNREAPGMPVGAALLDLLLEVHGQQHFEEVILALREAGLRGVPGTSARLVTEGARRFQAR
ncbi:MAG: threonine ammonia-lyase [Chloroflexi bacterium CFX7]|nr:threonine ammonia-lyase [Chloroflexi bacterium CFX7]